MSKFGDLIAGVSGEPVAIPVVEDATKAEIKRAFAKSLKGKKMNKKILSEFIELVA